MRDKKYSIITKTLSVLVGALYMGWIVGYVINPEVALRGAASDLAVHSQPGWYIFLAFHGVLFAIVSVLGLLIWKCSTRSKVVRLILFAYALYGLFTLVSSIISLPCVSSSEVCDMTSRSYLHIITGATAISLLTVSFIFVKHHLLDNLFMRVLQGIIVASWILAIVITQLLLMGYSGMLIAVSQRVFLTGFAVIAVSIPIILCRETALADK